MSKFPQFLLDFISQTEEKTRTTNIDFELNLPLNQLCQIYLAVYDIVVEHVENFISSHSNFEKIAFFVGTTGFGTTSTVLALIQSNQSNQSINNELVGKSSITTQTSIPNCFYEDGIILIDFPGFQPTQGKMMWLAFEASLKFLFDKYSKYSILIIVSAISAQESRFRPADDLYDHLQRLFSKNFTKKSIMAFTNYSNLITYIDAKRNANDHEKAQLYWDKIHQDEQIWLKKFHMTTFLRFDDLGNKQLMQSNFQFLKFFSPPVDIESHPYEMPVYCKTLIYKQFLKLAEDGHEKMQIPFVDKDQKNLLPQILSSCQCPAYIILFLRHKMLDPDFFKNLHNEFVENISAKFNSEISGLLPYQLTHLISTLKNIKNENLTNLPPLKLCVKKDTKLPQWVLKSVSLTSKTFLIDVKIVNNYFDSLKL